jgi:DNA-binding PucR family transcriptional regulator
MVKVADSIPPTSGLDHAEVLKFLWGRAGRWINESVELLMLAYIGEREAGLHGALARRSEVVQAILRGDPVGIDQAAQDLGHKLRAPQTCLVLWFDQAPADQSSAPLESLAQAIAREVDAARPLTHMAGRRELWAWIATREPLNLQRVEELVSAAGARAAIGRSGPGIEGFRTSHAEAVDAERFVVASDSTSTATAYADVELACLVSKNPDAARRLVERELGGLAANDPALDPVRQTLGHYLRSGSNIVLTAKDLFVHRNTVRYRLGQAEELVGHPLTERRTEMDLALRLLEWWPSGPAA